MQSGKATYEVKLNTCHVWVLLRKFSTSLLVYNVISSHELRWFIRDRYNCYKMCGNSTKLITVYLHVNDERVMYLHIQLRVGFMMSIEEKNLHWICITDLCKEQHKYYNRFA